MRREIVVAFALAGCSFPERTDSLTCGVTADCDDGRACEQGFCVVAPDARNEEPIPMVVDAAPPPDLAPDVAPRICEGTSDPDGNCYVVFRTAQDRKTRAAASLACEELDMTLAIINSATSNATVQGLVTGLDVWLGATDVAAEGTYLWPDGTPLTFANFRAGEPNNGAGNGAENCLVIEGGKGGTWDDRPCGQSLPYVCGFLR